MRSPNAPALHELPTAVVMLEMRWFDNFDAPEAQALLFSRSTGFVDLYTEGGKIIRDVFLVQDRDRGICYVERAGERRIALADARICAWRVSTRTVEIRMLRMLMEHPTPGVRVNPAEERFPEDRRSG